MSKHLDYFHFAKKVRRVLLAAGEDGMAQSVLYHKVRTRHWQINELLDLLTGWQSRNWVQSFSAKTYNAKLPSTIWRATVLLQSDFFDASSVDLRPTLEDSDDKEHHKDQDV
jgi:hypothetical protein